MMSMLTAYCDYIEDVSGSHKADQCMAGILDYFNTCVNTQNIKRTDLPKDI